MELQEAKEKYIQTWGTLASQWGTNRTMAQIHALLLISPKALSTEEIMDELKISRGNANTNIRALLDWDLITKELVPGDRKEYFKAEKDILEMFKRIVKERKKRELESIISTMNELKEVNDSTNEGKEFKKVIAEIYKVTKKSNRIINSILKLENSWFFDKISKLLN
ncbi:transcriptional regulator [Apibacter muscae]|uniref:GbsR/MarR family transcriptional regulator n=1 Tax=Apibacter muscae TaxID=2509004 RepID=UPI0011ABC87E|nr:MarR family transcriptional regulator [Apibacter muscae]TWP28523.1 transcriptional regulator [Apibacter muscae]